MQRIKRFAKPSPRESVIKRPFLSQSHYQLLSRVYGHFNATLFQGVLPPIEGSRGQGRACRGDLHRGQEGEFNGLFCARSLGSALRRRQDRA